LFLYDKEKGTDETPWKSLVEQINAIKRFYSFKKLNPKYVILAMLSTDGNCEANILVEDFPLI
jgi:hypothetical protein